MGMRCLSQGTLSPLLHPKIPISFFFCTPAVEGVALVSPGDV